MSSNIYCMPIMLSLRSSVDLKCCDVMLTKPCMPWEKNRLSSYGWIWWGGRAIWIV